MRRNRCGNSSDNEAVVSDQCAQPAGEVEDVGDVREHVVADDQVSAAVKRRDLLAAALGQERDLGGYSPLAGHRGDIGGGFDTQATDPAADDLLQEIAVVARDLDDEAVAGRARAWRPCRHEPLSMLHPAGGIGREVRRSH